DVDPPGPRRPACARAPDRRHARPARHGHRRGRPDHPRAASAGPAHGRGDRARPGAHRLRLGAPARTAPAAHPVGALPRRPGPAAAARRRTAPRPPPLPLTPVRPDAPPARSSSLRTPDHTRTSPGPLAADGAVALDYARRMFHRQSDPLPPPGFRVDWDDQPFRHTFYRDAPKLPLPAPSSLPVPAAVLPTVDRTRTSGASAQPTLQELSSALACYAVTGRRTSPDWNEGSTRKLHTGQATWSRPTASGGGMYPVETYLVAGAGAVLPCGV